MWRDLLPIGRDRTSGGYFRQPFTGAERELDAWFVAQCIARELTVETDAFGNRIGWWRPDQQTEDLPGLVTGSHLDSVLDGGAFDGPLGVVSAFAAIDLMRERGVVPTGPLGVSAFVEEEGSRFGLACLGSRLAVGTLDWATARELRDRDGVFLPDAMAEAGLDPEGPERLSPIGTFVELHVEQGRDLVERGAAVGVASGIWPHGRYRFEFQGEANHAGTTRMSDRRDPMLTFAMTALAANKSARSTDARATFGRVEVAPNGTNAVPSRVTAWMDARSASEEALTQLVADVERLAGDRAHRDGTTVTVTAESVSGVVHFHRPLATRIGTSPDGSRLPVLPTQAGHDAGIMQSVGMPTAMLFVRNPTGISHSPVEHAEVADCLEGVAALADGLERLL